MDHNILNLALTIGTIQFLAVASPGPDFAIVTRTSLILGKKFGFAVTFGILLGICVHLIAAQTGLSLLIISSPSLHAFMKYAGALYLLYVGVLCLKSVFSTTATSENSSTIANASIFQQIKLGFITNILNPKAIFYFLSLSSQIAAPTLSTLDKLILCLIIVTVSGAWFGFCSLVLTQPTFKSKFMKFERTLNAITGVAFIFFSINLILMD